ncbi:MAG: hypothetical protein ACKO38_00575 [Planctomycetota bacterium]
MPLALTSIWLENIEMHTPINLGTSTMATVTMIIRILVADILNAVTVSMETASMDTMSMDTRLSTTAMNSMTRSTFRASRAKTVFFPRSERLEFPRQSSTAS